MYNENWCMLGIKSLIKCNMVFPILVIPFRNMLNSCDLVIVLILSHFVSYFLLYEGLHW